MVTRAEFVLKSLSAVASPIPTIYVNLLFIYLVFSLQFAFKRFSVWSKLCADSNRSGPPRGIRAAPYTRTSSLCHLHNLLYGRYMKFVHVAQLDVALNHYSAMEHHMGLEPTIPTWKDGVLPLH